MKHLTTEDVAAALGVAASTVRSYNARRQMPEPSGHVGRTPYWTPEDIEPWITGHLHGAASLRRERAARRTSGTA
jgi:predicted DNA-binding transcriptional regulator AlpA